MKYVRTKNGIYEVEKKERAYFEGQPWLYCCKGKYELVEEKDIIKQADAIEDLCDVYVIVVEIDGQKQKYVRALYDVDEYNPFNFEEAKTMRSYIIGMLAENFGSDGIKTDLLYGAVWTDEGLRYVAKTNVQGELELL